jgi:hypothetical protein
VITFTWVAEDDADRDEIAAERWTLQILGAYLKQMYPPKEPEWLGMIGSMTAIPLVVDDDLPYGEVHVRRRPPMPIGDLAALIRDFTVAAPPPPGVASWCMCSVFKQGQGWHVQGCPRVETAEGQR